MKKTILTMIALGSIATNIFMGFQIHKLNNTIETNCIREEQTHIVSARYSYGGQVFTESGHEFIYKRSDYDELYRASGVLVKAMINDNGTPYKISDDRVVTIWEDKENLTSIKDVEYKKEELTAILERK